MDSDVDESTVTWLKAERVERAHSGQPSVDVPTCVALVGDFCIIASSRWDGPCIKYHDILAYWQQGKGRTHT